MQSIRSYLALAVLLVAAAPSRADDSPVVDLAAFNVLDGGHKIADRVVEILGLEQIRVDPIALEGLPNLGLMRTTVGALEELGCRVVPKGQRAKFSIEGEIVPPVDEDRVPRCIVLMRVKEGRTRRAHAEFTVEITSERAVHETVTRTSETLAPPIPGLLITSVVRPAKPVVKKVETVLRLYPSHRSPYSIAILIKNEAGQYLPAPIRLVDGQPRVQLQMGQIYAVAVYNESNYDAGVQLFVDGLSRFSVSNDPNFRNAYDVVRRNSAGRLKGWFRDVADGSGGREQHLNEFQIGRLADSVASKMFTETTDVGTITVNVSVAAKKGEELPNDMQSREAPPAGTILGPKAREPVELVERALGPVRAVFRVFYDVNVVVARR